MSFGNSKSGDLPLSYDSTPQTTSSPLPCLSIWQALDAMNVAFAMQDNKGNVTFTNKYFAKLFGYEIKDTLGRPVTDFFDNENKTIFAEQTTKRKKGHSDPYEFSITCKNGQKQPVLVYPSPIYDQNNKFVGSIGIFMDMLNWKLFETEMLLNQYSLESSLEDQTEEYADIKEKLSKKNLEQIKADQSLKQTRMRFAHITNTIKDVFWITDLNSTKVLYASPAYEEIWGRTVQSLYENPKQWINAVVEQDREYVCQSLEQIPASGSYDVEYRITHPDGSLRWIRDRGYPVCNETGQLLNLAGIAEDITLRKKAELELQEKRLQIQALSSEMTSIEERDRKLIAEGLHDTIIQPMVFLDIKIGTLAAEQKTAENIESCQQIRQILAQLIEKTRSFTFDLSDPILYELGIETALDDWLTTEIEAKHHLPVVLKTEGNIENLGEDISVFIFKAAKELMINIVKHAQADSAFVSVIHKEGNVEICVKDNGKGFDVNDRSTMYADKKGLGIFSLKERLIHLQGFLDIQSDPEKGTTVTINIPIVSDKNDKGKQPE